MIAQSLDQAEVLMRGPTEISASAGGRWPVSPRLRSALGPT